MKLKILEKDNYEMEDIWKRILLKRKTSETKTIVKTKHLEKDNSEEGKSGKY